MRPIQEIVGAALRDRLLEADAAVQRNVALCAASAAARDVALVDPEIDEAFEDLLLERYSPGMRAAVEAIEEHLDEIAWSRQELVDRGEAERSEYEIAFRRARAAAAVKMCLDATALPPCRKPFTRQATPFLLTIAFRRRWKQSSS